MSTLRVTNIENPSTTSGGIDIDTSGHVTVDGVAMPSAGPLSNRNKIINGDMRIDQRNAGASVTVGTDSFAVDRWAAAEITDGSATNEQVQDAPAGFTDSIKWTTTTADASLAAGQFSRVGQIIEGFNITDLNWGSASAKTITLSFWVRSSLTGTFAGGVRNSAGDRSYVFTYSISSADTWEQKTVTIEGDTSGTWLTDNGRGIWLIFDLGSGSDFQKTANTWGSGNCWTTSSAVSVIGTLNATWYLTGVQLEVGSVATPFEHRSYSDELARCKRYFTDIGGTACHFRGTNTDSIGVTIPTPVQMRATPSISNLSIGSCRMYDSSGVTFGSASASVNTANGAMYDIFVSSLSGVTDNAVGFINFTADLVSEL